jgi:hypothetical protein
MNYFIYIFKYSCHSYKYFIYIDILFSELLKFLLMASDQRGTIMQGFQDEILSLLSSEELMNLPHSFVNYFYIFSYFIIVLKNINNNMCVFILEITCKNCIKITA